MDKLLKSLLFLVRIEEPFDTRFIFSTEDVREAREQFSVLSCREV
jgi:hypothetical protein